MINSRDSRLLLRAQVIRRQNRYYARYGLSSALNLFTTSEHVLFSFDQKYDEKDEDFWARVKDSCKKEGLHEVVNLHKS